MQPTQISATATQPAAPPQGQKLENAAREFEAQLLAELLRQVNSNASLMPGSESSGADEQYQSMATQAVAEGMAAGGGLGIAKSMLSQIDKVKG